MEEAAKRTPWNTTAPGRAPYLVPYGQTVLDERNISEQRLKNDAAAWRKRIAPRFQGIRVTEVSPADVRDLVKRLDESYAASTVGDTYGLIRFVLATAQADGYIATTPCVRISLPRRQPEDEVKAAPYESVEAIATAIDPRYELLLAGFKYHVGRWLACETVDIVIANGLIEVSHREVLITSHARQHRVEDEPAVWRR